MKNIFSYLFKFIIHYCLPVLMLFVISIIFYGSTLRGDLGNPDVKKINIDESLPKAFESSHERSPYAVVVAYTTYGKFDLDQQLADFGAPDVGYFKGKFYSFFPAGIPLLIMPLYLIGLNYNIAQLLSYLTIPIFGFLSLICIYFISKNIFKLPFWASMLSAILYGFGTTSWSYAITIYQHIPSTFFILSAFYAAYKYKKSKLMGIVWGSWIWLSYAAAIFIDYPNAFMMLPIMFYFLYSAIPIHKIKQGLQIGFRPTIIISSICFVILMVIHGYYNYTNYGSWTTVAQSFSRYEKDKFDLLIKKVVSKEEDLKLGKGKENPLKIFKEQDAVSGLNTLLVDDDKGIFYFTPVLILGLFGALIAFKQKYSPEAIVLFSLFLVNAVLYGSFRDPWGGWAFGPRYLIPSMAALSILTLIWVNNFKYRFIGKIIFFILFIYSSGIALAGALTTNVVPPKIEAIPMKMQFYNYLLNFDHLFRNISGSFFYNFYLSNYTILYNLYFLLLLLLLVIVFIFLFILPLFVKRK